MPGMDNWVDKYQGSDHHIDRFVRNKLDYESHTGKEYPGQNIRYFYMVFTFEIIFNFFRFTLTRVEFLIHRWNYDFYVNCPFGSFYRFKTNIYDENCSRFKR